MVQVAAETPLLLKTAFRVRAYAREEELNK